MLLTELLDARRRRVDPGVGRDEVAAARVGVHVLHEAQHGDAVAPRVLEVDRRQALRVDQQRERLVEPPAVIANFSGFKNKKIGDNLKRIIRTCYGRHSRRKDSYAPAPWGSRP